MSVRFLPILLLLCLLVLPAPAVSAAAPAVEVTGDQAILRFPESITFQAQISGSAPITSVTLEYGADQLTCGTVVAKAFPQFEPGPKISVEWKWDMRQSGSLPPGETVWWRWRIVDADGRETLSQQKTVIWLDSVHKWKTVTDGDLRLHWYSGDPSFAQTLLAAASAGLKRMQTEAGLTIEAPVDYYIYADTNAMREAVLYEPSWTGGLAFPINDIVILGISADQVDWGKDSIVHELTHVLVGHLTFSCLGDVPTWLNEGLAVFSEGELDPASQAQLDEAIRQDTLLTVRSLSGGFSEIPSKAYLSYSQSYSIVKFLIETHGQEKMNALLLALRDGSTVDAALRQIYGFDVDGLEREWRKAIGAAAAPVSAQPTVVPTPTFVPTFVPVSGIQAAVTPTPYVIPTSSFSTPSEPASPTMPDGAVIASYFILLGLCCLLLLIVGVAVLLIVRRRNRQKGESQ